MGADEVRLGGRGWGMAGVGDKGRVVGCLVEVEEEELEN